MRKIITAAVVAASISGFAVSAQQTIDNPMTRAMLGVYDKELEANPQNADIYFRRANEYYKFNQYLRALADVEKALEFTPESDKDMRFQELMLRADIYQMQGKHSEALADFTAALKIDPTSFLALYQKSNEEYELGEYAAAKAGYTRMRAINPRSPEALTGLARVAVKENNIGLASEYMDAAVDMMSADSDIYIRRASVRRMQGNITGAVEDLLSAISINNNTKAFEELIDLANNDYPAVISAISTAISYAPQQPMLYYIRGFIAQAHDHFSTALADYRKLVSDNMYSYAGLFNSMAECQLALCKFDEALDNVDHAISMEQERRQEFFLTKARILFAQKKYKEAVAALDIAKEAGKLSPRGEDFEGVLDFAMGEFSDANGLYGEMTIDNPERMSSYIYRAWVLNDGLKEPSNALKIYNRVVKLTSTDNDDNPEDAGYTKSAGNSLSAIESYRGFALLYSGNKEEALKWVEDLQRDFRDTDGYLSFMAACLYANAGETDKAFSSLDKALQLGYGNLYKITEADYGRVSLAPIRNDSRFAGLLARYKHLFE